MSQSNALSLFPEIYSCFLKIDYGKPLFAAEELKKYLRMMMPNSEDFEIVNNTMDSTDEDRNV